MPDALPPTNAYERSRQALLALFSASPVQAGRALVAPDTLSPEERKTAAEKLGLPESSVTSTLASFASNPAVLIGTAMALHWPIPTLDRLAVFAKDAERLFALPPVARWAFDAHQIFEGTRLPGILSRIETIGREFMRDRNVPIGLALAKYEEESGQRFNQLVSTKIGAYLDGLGDSESPVWNTLKARFPDKAPQFRANLELTPHETKLAESLKTILAGSFDDVIKNAKASDPSRIQRLLRTLGVDTIDDVKSIREYWPHVVVKGGGPPPNFLQEATDVFGQKARAIGRATAQAGGRASKNLQSRYWRAMPDPDALIRAGVVDEQTGGLLRQLIDEEGRPVYTHDLFRSLEKYHYGLGHTKAFLVPEKPDEIPLGERVVEQYHKLIGDGDKVRARMLSETYIPIISGQMTATQARRSEMFDATKAWAARWIEKSPLPQDIKARLTEPLTNPNSLSYKGVGSAISRWMYSSTLGANLPSSAFNLLQTFLTTVPMIGPKYTAIGMREVFAGVKDMAEELAGKPMTREAIREAFHQRFNAFATTGIDVDSQLLEHIKSAYANAHIAAPSNFSNSVETVEKALLLPFTLSERFNRLVAFEGTYAKALEELPGKTIHHPVTGEAMHLGEYGKDGRIAWAARDAAEAVARTTQFGGSTLTQPYGLLNLPGPLKQFASFQSKFGAFLAGPGMHFGAEPGSLNLGTLGRGLLTSGLIYEAGKNFLGTDLSRGLMFGAMPELRENGPFAPWPFVPPVAQIAGAVGMDLAAGNLHETTKALPLLVPGGLALSRASTAIAPPLAKAIGRPYADYSQVANGRIPVYTGGGTLQGYYTPTQLFARAVGIGDLQGSQEQVLSEYLLKQRDRWREYRKEYLDALTNNDPRTASQVQDEFRRVYPGLGDIPVKQSDIKAVQMKRDMPRLERIMQTIPAEMRPAFAASIAASLGSSAEQFLGVDPALLGQPRPSRNLRRYPVQSQGGLQSQGTGNNARGDLAKITRDAGAQQRDEMTYTPLQGF